MRCWHAFDHTPCTGLSKEVTKEEATSKICLPDDLVPDLCSFYYPEHQESLPETASQFYTNQGWTLVFIVSVLVFQIRNSCLDTMWGWGAGRGVRVQRRRKVLFGDSLRKLGQWSAIREKEQATGLEVKFQPTVAPTVAPCQSTEGNSRDNKGLRADYGLLRPGVSWPLGMPKGVRVEGRRALIQFPVLILPSNSVQKLILNGYMPNSFAYSLAILTVISTFEITLIFPIIKK